MTDELRASDWWCSGMTLWCKEALLYRDRWISSTVENVHTPHAATMMLMVRFGYYKVLVNKPRIESRYRVPTPATLYCALLIRPYSLSILAHRTNSAPWELIRVTHQWRICWLAPTFLLPFNSLSCSFSVRSLLTHFNTSFASLNSATRGAGIPLHTSWAGAREVPVSVLYAQNICLVVKYLVHLRITTCMTSISCTLRRSRSRL